MPSATRVLAFLLVFTALFLFAMMLAVAIEFSDEKWIERLVRIGEGLGRLTLVAIAIAFILVEGVPMLAEWARKQWQKEEREKGRVEGRAEGHTEGRTLEREAWQNWYRELEAWERRKAAAEREGETFDEPRPAPPGED